MEIVAHSGLSAMAIYQNPGVFRSSLVGDTAFKGIEGFGETFLLEFKGILVFFQIPVGGRGTYPGKLFRDCSSDTEGWPGSDGGHLLPHERREDFPALVPEKGPDQPEARDDLV